MSLSNISKPTASFGMAQFSHQHMSGKTSDSVFNLNQHGGRLSAKQLHCEDNFTGRLTQANESEGGNTDREFGIDELGN